MVKLLLPVVLLFVTLAGCKDSLPPEQIKGIRQAAEEGDSRAQFVLGNMLQSGDGVPQDYVDAVKWYRKAAEQGYASAQCNLGVMYANGDGVLEDDAEAVNWYRKAAEQGSAVAQLNLGKMYGNGGGITKDYVKSYMWLNLAAAQGNEDAILWKDIYSRSMTSGQISRAQKLSREWMAKHSAKNK